MCRKIARQWSGSEGSCQRDFKLLPNESYKKLPHFKYVIQGEGTVSDVKITRSSGVADIDKTLLDAMARWKYKPRPAGCGIIESEMSVTIDFE
jgi:TonB family protein